MTRPLPVPTTITKPYWDAANNGVFMIQQCQDCQGFIMYPRCFCPYCLSERVQWVTSEGKGTVYTYSIVHRAPSPDFAEEVPYIVAYIELDEGPRMMSRIHAEPDQIVVGMRVKVDFEKFSPEITLPVFVPLKK